MIDANKCKMVFDDDEEEYVEFYDWSKLEDELAGTWARMQWHQPAFTQAHLKSLTQNIETKPDGCADKQLAVTETGEGADSIGYELEVVGDAEAGTSGKVLGSREFARYYKQHHKPADMRTSVQVNTVVAK